jgi:hypothetical protein
MSDETPRPNRRTLLAGMALMAGSAALPARAGESKIMKHVVLLGDSIFDNAATLAARDGATTADIEGQLEQMPSDATHLVVSIGGNDALQEKDLLEEKARSVAEVLDKLAKIKTSFRKSYAAMLEEVTARKLPTAICTIYEARYQDPTTRAIAATGLSIFNDVITREALSRGLPLIDLRIIFNHTPTTPTTSSPR